MGVATKGKPTPRTPLARPPSRRAAQAMRMVEMARSMNELARRGPLTWQMAATDGNAVGGMAAGVVIAVQSASVNSNRIQRRCKAVNGELGR